MQENACISSHRTPWDDPSFAAGAAAAMPPAAAAPEPAPAPPLQQQAAVGGAGYTAAPAVPQSVARLRAKFQMEEAQQMLQRQLVCRRRRPALPPLRCSVCTVASTGGGNGTPRHRTDWRLSRLMGSAVDAAEHPLPTPSVHKLCWGRRATCTGLQRAVLGACRGRSSPRKTPWTPSWQARCCRR